MVEHLEVVESKAKVASIFMEEDKEAAIGSHLLQLLGVTWILLGHEPPMHELLINRLQNDGGVINRSLFGRAVPLGILLDVADGRTGHIKELVLDQVQEGISCDDTNARNDRSLNTPTTFLSHFY